MKKRFLLLASLRFVKLSLTVAILMLYGRTFGIGMRMDSWVFASGVAASVGLLLWGPVNEVVRSRFVSQVAEMGEEGARSSATSLLFFSSSVSVLVCFALFLGAPHIVGTLYAASEPGAQAVVLKIFEFMLPSIVVGQVLSLGTAYMNCYDIIYVPEFIGIAGALLNLACVFTLSPQLGIYSLVLGYYLGAVLSLAVILRFLKKRGFLHLTVDVRAVFKDVRAAILFASPLFLAYGAGQLNGLLEKYLSSLMGVGVMSSVNYAAQIKTTLQAVLTTVMFSLVVPQLTHAASQKDKSPFVRKFVESQRVAMIFVLFIMPFVFGTADATAAILFGKTAISANALQKIALLIRLYIVAFVPTVLYLVYGVALLAQQKGRAYAAAGVAAQLLSAIICVSLFRALGPTVFPIALLLSHLAAAILMLYNIEVRGRRMLLAEALGFLVLIAMMAVVLSSVYHGLYDALQSSELSLGLLGLVYGLVVLVMALHFNSKKMQYKRLKALFDFAKND